MNQTEPVFACQGVGLWIFHSSVTDRRVICPFRGLDWTQTQFEDFRREVWG